MTLEEAELTRSEWITAFSEMTEHMRPEKAKNTRISRNAYGMERHEADEEEEEDDGGGRDYMAKLPCGQIRNRCSYNAACNTQFQGTVALGAKAAGWNLVYNGYGDRLLNFVHCVVDIKPGELLEHPSGQSAAKTAEAVRFNDHSYMEVQPSGWKCLELL